MSHTTETRWEGYYGPWGSRRKFLAGKKDHRDTEEFAERVREQRQLQLRPNRQAIHPGSQ